MPFHSHSLFRTLVLLTIVAVPVSASDDRRVTHLTSTQELAIKTDASSMKDLIEGFTEPYADIEVAASEMGAIASIRVSEGNTVKAGQIIASLDDRVLRASLNVAAAAAESAGELNSAIASLAIRELESQKLNELFQRRHASQRELDRVQGDLKVARARVQIAREEAEVRRLEHARIVAQLEQRQVVSPIDGVVVEVRKDTGEFVSPSDPVVARVVQLDPLLVAFSVPMDQRNLISANQPVLMTVGKSAAVHGRVEFVSPIADAGSGTFRAKVLLPNSAGRWHGGEKSVLHLDKESLERASQADRLASRPNN